ncbi:hypothetical protein MBLNU230_g4109t1 [Neophaeotheca triangularis]
MTAPESSQRATGRSTPSTRATNPTETITTSTPSSTAPAPATESASPSNSTVAGIAIGASAGVFLILLALAYLYRRHRKTTQEPAFSLLKPGSNRNSSQIYPELAYLYDPVITPAASRQTSRRASREPSPSAHLVAPTALGRGLAASRNRLGSASDDSPMVVSLEEAAGAWGQREWQTPASGSVNRESAFAPFRPRASTDARPLLAPLDFLGDGRLGFVVREYSR